MGVKVATPCLQWSQPSIPQSPSSSQTLASAISSPSSKRCSSSKGRTLSCRFVLQKLDQPSIFGTPLSKPHRSKSCELWKSSRRPCILNASMDSFSDEEFSKKIHELALKFQIADNNEEDEKEDFDLEPSRNSKSDSFHYRHDFDLGIDTVSPPWEEISHDSTIERKANSVDLPLSLRIIKRKLQWAEGFTDVSEMASCSIKKAFSSMVFMIREVQSFTLQMREVLFFEDLQAILSRVHKEMHASFVWLFQQVFSHTPTLMVYVMILLANFTVYSMESNSAIAAAAAPPLSAQTEISSVIDTRNPSQNFASRSLKTFTLSSSADKTISIDGGGTGGGKVRPVSSGEDGGGRFNHSNHLSSIIPDGSSSSQLSSTFDASRETESVSVEDELRLWNSIVEEAQTMQDSLDHETIKGFVSPVNAKMEEDDYADYFKTELVYQTGLIQEPNNTLLLVNYAQFLYLVAQDYDRAEEIFKRAVKVKPADAEAFSKYASFLWRVRENLWAAEETFLEAISVDPNNSYHAANYAHFLWNTGGEDTCFPLDTPETL